MKVPARSPSLALALAISLAAASLATAQGPGGPGGPGGRGGWGGGPGGSLLGLAQMVPVQEELKVTPDQAAKIKTLGDAVGKKQQDLRAAFRPNNGNPGQPGGGQGNNPGQVGGAPGQPNTGQPANGGGRGNRGSGGGRGGFFANMTDEERAAMQERFAVMQAEQAKLTKDTEAALAKILDKKQQTRLAQIHLQRQGLRAFVTPELTGKLNIDDDRVAQIQEVLDGQNQARRAQFAKMGEVYAQFTGGNARPSREERQVLDSNPEFQKQRDAQQKATDAAAKTLEEQAKVQIGRLLSKKQKDAYAKLIGAPFDLNKLGNGRGGPNGGNPPGGAPAPAPTATLAPTGQPPATPPGQPARKSLRDRRGTTTP